MISGSLIQSFLGVVSAILWCGNHQAHAFSDGKLLPHQTVILSQTIARSPSPLSARSSIHSDETNDPTESRRSFGTRTLGFLGLVAATTTCTARTARAAPPFAIIAEELGYFPVNNAQNQTVYVPKRVQRQSSEQAVALAQALKDQGAVLYTAYWCPHCARQKELLGRQATSVIRNVECAPRGFQAQPQLCAAQKIEGYPTWIIPATAKGQKPIVISGERSLSGLAQAIGFAGFSEELEENVPPPLGSASCQQ
mmetsp:Transcript_16882/g.34879  ORF Transcript_16882/g.34879 Transcript_16882/m.34879 type:complete len:253 (-) Transcript_16882:3357-4115(-)